MQATITRSDDPHPTLTITLDPPLAFKGGKIGEITLREPKAREVREAEKLRTADAPWASQIAYELRLVTSVAGLPAEAGEVMPVQVINHAITFLQEFIEAGYDEADDDQVPEATTLPIDPPIVFVGTSFAELDLREPLASEIRNARQLMRTAGSLFESRRAQMMLVTTVSGLPAPVVDALPISLLNQAARILGRFTMAGRKTGSN